MADGMTVQQLQHNTINGYAERHVALHQDVRVHLHGQTLDLHSNNTSTRNTNPVLIWGSLITQILST